MYSRPITSPGHRVLPETGVSLALACRRQSDGTITDAELVYIGPIDRIRFFAPDPGVHLEAIGLKPEWSRDLLCMDPAEHFNEVRVIRQFTRVLDRIAKTRSTNEALSILMQHVATLRERLRRAEATPAHRALEHLRRDECARIDVHSLARSGGVSERHLRRLITRTTGLSPVQFQRITRLNRAVAAADKTATPEWARLAIDMGYYDQPHMIDEFRALTGCTPVTLHAERRSET